MNFTDINVCFIRCHISYLYINSIDNKDYVFNKIIQFISGSRDAILKGKLINVVVINPTNTQISLNILAFISIVEILGTCLVKP